MTAADNTMHTNVADTTGAGTSNGKDNTSATATPSCGATAVPSSGVTATGGGCRAA
eukprot:CAMPEP_0202907604 /NCGR_PEP_ID=MMETSP1392-20130828/43215_1 /ASSEMBLY_ACC=CAM_ASM_000868 /TAXON_ID=225041 /ORGANISM="Chlamydomonas chlamydogama, Strain SAG 11-48b" /LENGTH=55 /DNA_ID=CAMNT_0049596591 /DNA_START=95 /DNA_END=259 /DNA_ORIENTATION=-